MSSVGSSRVDGSNSDLQGTSSHDICGGSTSYLDQGSSKGSMETTEVNMAMVIHTSSFHSRTRNTQKNTRIFL